MKEPQEPHYFDTDPQELLAELGQKRLTQALSDMLLIRHFETRGEAAYQQGKIGGFFHSYAGQEAIQTACITAAGTDHWYTTSYRCHALALLLGVSPDAAMAELYGKATGNAKGRGGSMHMYAERMLGGLAIVGGHVPIATGAAFSLKYQHDHTHVSFCFLGDGAVVQGAVHESLNLASLWNLPCIYVIENNQWGMGTAVSRAVSFLPIAEKLAIPYGLSSYTLHGLDFLHCYAGFKAALHEVLTTSRPVLIEATTERFRGHSISDPGLYRSKEELQHILAHDPIQILKATLIQQGLLTEAAFTQLDKQAKDRVIKAMQFAEDSPWPDPMSLEEGVMAP